MLIGLLFVVGLQVQPQDTFSVQTDLRGLYDEIAQTTLQLLTDTDVDELHAVLFTTDWSIVDSKGQRHAWPELRAQAIAALKEPQADSIKHTIQKLTLTPQGATVVVMVETARTVVDSAGRYGTAGAMHTLTDDVVYRDQWVTIEGSWRLKQREQLTEPKIWVDKRMSDTH